MILQHTFAVEMLAAAMALLTAPLLADLTVSLSGNLRRPVRVCVRGARAIRLAVVIPAHDEEKQIAPTVESALAASWVSSFWRGAEESAEERWRVPILVVAHNCTDRTPAVAADAGARVIELKRARDGGKAAALRCGFEAARAMGANAFLMVDADSVASPNLIAATCEALEDGAAATQCRYELELPESQPANMGTRLRVMAFRGINVMRARGRARLGFSAGVFGNGFAMTAETLERVPFAVDSICEDLEYHARLVAAGLTVRWVEDAFVHGPLAPAGRARATQEARWEGGRFHVATRATGSLLKAALRGNWRALETLCEMWSQPLSRGILVLIFAGFVPVLWLHIYALAGAMLAAGYVLESAFAGDSPKEDLEALAFAPIHLLWKLAITPLVLRQSRAGAEWARTRREVQAR